MQLNFDVIREVLLYIEKETKYIEKEITDKDLELVFGCAKTIDSAPISLLRACSVSFKNNTDKS